MQCDYKTRGEARASLFDYMEVFYNRHQARNDSLNRKSPIVVHSIGNVVNHPGASRLLEIHDHDEVSHHKDGVLTLLDDLPYISVFYYRGDRPGEGGSDQRWCFPVLLDLVLLKILDGEIFCCDGSNGAGFLFEQPRELAVGGAPSYRNLLL